MLKRTKLFGLAAWFLLMGSGCAAILGNDWDIDPDAGPTGGASSASTGPGGSSDVSGTGSPLSTSSASTTDSSSATGGNTGAGGAAGAGTDGTGGSVSTGGAGGGTSSAGGASGGTSSAGGAAGSAGDGGATAAGGAGGAAGTTSSTGGGGSSGAAGLGGSRDASTGNDAAADAGPPDVAASNDAAPDVPPGSDAGSTIDAAPDVVAPSCNPINASCASGSLVCNAGFATCNNNALDGCECATPGCCGAACQTKHVACMQNANPSTPCTDGTGFNYYDCVALGTFTSVQAMTACTAVTGSMAACAAGTCPGQHDVVCSFDGIKNCICWEYAGPSVGRVYRSNNTNCFCPTTTSPTWN